MARKRILQLVLVAVVFIIGVTAAQSQEENDMDAAVLEANKALVRAFAAAENSRNYGALDEIVSENFVRHSVATPDVTVTSREQLKAFFAANAASFSDYSTTFEMMAAEGDLVAVYVTYAGTMDGAMGDIPATGNYAQIPFMAFFRIEDGMIAELWVEWDNVNFMSQLGLFPPQGSAGD